ncbi:MAG: hypothetical protein ACERKV_12845 [Clostridiaceae bacterium]
MAITKGFKLILIGFIIFIIGMLFSKNNYIALGNILMFISLVMGFAGLVKNSKEVKKMK